MNLTQILRKTKCELSGCKNMARFEIKDEQDLKKGIILCENCLKDISNAYLKVKAPKQPKTPFKKQKTI